eukprot:TRINITY_DN93701_c0_g1_i1.p1 TRINITY_DN93701_c0_g1~~TRINITY_DN93701_c0_g1_i1.p1  ORF type:complete len:514 (+),score=94.62 TRINITY_DN93701_c0_g1_i1:58-1599(+)
MSSGSALPAERAPKSKRGGQQLAEGEERPTKRRRLSDASVLCMRELFRTAVNDGDISEDKRVVLQNAAVLLSQVDGKTWVNFPDSQGQLQDLTPPQLKKVRPFFSKVADELKTAEMKVLSEASSNHNESFDCLELESVPWAEGITSRELLACCVPDEELLFSSRHDWVEKVTRFLPSRYLIRSRVREMLNHYYIHRRGSHEESRPSSQDESPKRARVHIPGIQLLRRAFVAVAVTVGAMLGAAIRCFRQSRTKAIVAKAVVCIANAIAAKVMQLFRMMPLRDEPIWPVLRLCFAFLLQGQIKNFLELIVLIARLRVILCLASCNDFFGLIFFPFLLVARTVLGWNPGSWLLGCSCESGSTGSERGLSLLSLCPVKVTEWLFRCFKAIKYLKLIPGCSILSVVIDPCTLLLETVEPVAEFIFDLLFSVGFAEGLSHLARSIDVRAQHKLVYWSMRVGRMMREGPSDAEPMPMEGSASSAAPSEAPTTHQSDAADSPPRLPEWRDDGCYNIFDST